MKTLRKQNGWKFIALGVTAVSVAALAQSLFCWILVDDGKCGIELSPSPRDCIAVNCDDKKECRLLTYDMTGRTDCPSKGCFCAAIQYEVVQHHNPNPPPNYFQTCGGQGVPTLPPSGTGGDDTTGYPHGSECTVGG
jgi:hypothetical protein